MTEEVGTIKRSKKSETKKEMTAEEIADFEKTLMDVVAVLMPDMVDEAAPSDKEDPYDQILSVISTYSEKNKINNMINYELRRGARDEWKGKKR